MFGKGYLKIETVEPTEDEEVVVEKLDVGDDNMFKGCNKRERHYSRVKNK